MVSHNQTDTDFFYPDVNDVKESMTLRQGKCIYTPGTRFRLWAYGVVVGRWHGYRMSELLDLEEISRPLAVV